MFPAYTTSALQRQAPARSAAAAPVRLGVGLRFTPALHGFVARHREAIDYLCVAPEEPSPGVSRAGGGQRASIDSATHVLEAIGGNLPWVVRGPALAVGGDAERDRARLSCLAERTARCDVRWFSAQLVLAAEVAGCARHGAATPSPGDRDALKRVVEHVREVKAPLPVALLLETGIDARGVPRQDVSEPTLLHRICAATGCGIALDFDSVLESAIDRGVDPLALLDRVELARVVEIRVRASTWEPQPGAFFAATPCPPSTLEVLEAVLWRTPRLRAITVESGVGVPDARAGDRVLQMIEAARAAWNRYD